MQKCSSIEASTPEKSRNDSTILISWNTLIKRKKKREANRETEKISASYTFPRDTVFPLPVERKLVEIPAVGLKRTCIWKGRVRPANFDTLKCIYIAVHAPSPQERTEETLNDDAYVSRKLKPRARATIASGGWQVDFEASHRDLARRGSPPIPLFRDLSIILRCTSAYPRSAMSRIK